MLLIIPFIILFVLPHPSLSTDPDPLQDFCVADLNATVSVSGFPCKPISKVSADDFFFDGLSKEGNTNNPFGFALTLGNVLTLPGLNTLGLSMNRIDLAPGGMNPPHLHPRASEIVIVLKGKVLVGFVTVDNKYYHKVLRVGEVFIIPRALVHFQYNVGHKKAVVLAGFNSQLPGGVLVAGNLFASNPPIPVKILSKALLVNDDVINTIKSEFII
ncbi:germin-like protein subfamily T member 2 [Benincasa hispida]|uniref:germin-like protein subfamily T member 2 n=1 Tax=Benincasa hispida TaxID=102211 RepID=UPI001902A6FA|nr:germin-like protein subfamily T member 2 [Benincasa hispida]